MDDTGAASALSVNELLARFVVVDGWIRADGSIRQDAFLPPRDLNLSVTRHGALTMSELWACGRAVAQSVSHRRTTALRGRCDLAASVVGAQLLRVDLVPLTGNPNHAHITGWPLEKSAQKSLAQRLAASAVYVPSPD